MTSDLRAKKAASAIALVREKVNQFDYQNGVALLKNAKCPYPTRVIGLLKQEGFIQKQDDGMYQFAVSEPIFYGRLKTGLDQIARSVQNYCAKSNKIKKGLAKETEIENMISRLKEAGYVIFKSV